jgi:hypothetical protein
LAHEYIGLLEELDLGNGMTNRHADDNAATTPEVTEIRGLRMEDGSSLGKKGQVGSGRFVVPNVQHRAGNQVEVVEEGGEFERLSLWWTNTEVVKGHLKQILGVCSEQNDSGLSKSTFKGAVTMAAVIACYRKRYPSSEV